MQLDRCSLQRAYLGIRVSTCYGSQLFKSFAQDQDYIEDLRISGLWGEVKFELWCLFADCGRSFIRWALWSLGLAVLFGIVYYVMDIRYDPRECKRLRRIAEGPLIETLAGQETIPVSSDLLRKNNIYVLRVRGDSMIGDYVFDGDHLIVERRNAAKEGEMVVALIKNSETTLKRFRRDGRQIRLEQTDTSDDAVVFDEKDVAIQGIVVGILRKYRG